MEGIVLALAVTGKAPQVLISPALGSYEQLYSDLFVDLMELQNTLGFRRRRLPACYRKSRWTSSS
jgi:hypothetical protein